MTGPDEVTSGMELVVWLSIILVPSITTVVGLWVQSKRSASKHGDLADDVGAVKEQVKNDHTTNLREDIDELKGLLVRLDARTSRIGDELRADRVRARKVESDLYRQVNRTEHVIAKYHPDEVDDD